MEFTKTTFLWPNVLLVINLHLFPTSVIFLLDYTTSALYDNTHSQLSCNVTIKKHRYIHDELLSVFVYHIHTAHFSYGIQVDLAN